MKLDIFDVGHGSCALLSSSNGYRVLFDCAEDYNKPFHASTHLLGSGIFRVDALVVSHYDEDHVGDYWYLRQKIWVDKLVTNTSVTADQVRALKGEGGIGLGLGALLTDLDARGIYEDLTPSPWIMVSLYRNLYPVFRDTNNLSVVAFIHDFENGVSFLLPGDLETAGWESLLDWSTFRSELARVSVLVASHHGRVNGYCRRLFDYCSPQLIVISDGSMQYQSQALDYSVHATGVQFSTGTRRVLTTRRDGNITFFTGYDPLTNINLVRGFRVYTSR